MNRMPRVTRAVHNGLSEVILTLDACAGEDEDRYPAEHPIHDVIAWLREVERVADERIAP